MIPADFITEWRSEAPWVESSQVEQDLVISRALVEIFDDDRLTEALAFRGGTALYKLHLTPGPRYSEDIDLVQKTAEPIGPTIDRLRARLDPWLGDPKRSFKEGRVTLVYRFHSEDSPPLPLRLEGRDQLQGALRRPGLRDQRARDSLTLVLGQLAGLDVCARRAARHEAAGSLPAQEGPGPLRPLVGLATRQGRPRSGRSVLQGVSGRRRTQGLEGRAGGESGWEADGPEIHRRPPASPGGRDRMGSRLCVRLGYREITPRLEGDPWKGAGGGDDGTG